MSHNKFLLTRPLRDVTYAFRIISIQHQISTHTPLAGRDFSIRRFYYFIFISTHTPLAGRDYSRRNNLLY